MVRVHEWEHVPSSRIAATDLADTSARGPGCMLLSNFDVRVPTVARSASMMGMMVSLRQASKSRGWQSPWNCCWRGYARPSPWTLDRSTRRLSRPATTTKSSEMALRATQATAGGPALEPEPEPELEPWFLKKGGLRFSCKPGCGRCCTGTPGAVYFTEAEGKTLATHLGLSVREFYRTHARRQWGRWSLKERGVPDGRFDCEFLHPDGHTGAGRCSVHSVRPQQCRSYPFWPSSVQSQDAWAMEAEECPGIVSLDSGCCIMLACCCWAVLLISYRAREGSQRRRNDPIGFWH